MKIAVDCRHIDSSGVGVYTRGCLPFLLDSPDDFLLIGDSGRLKEFERPNTRIIHCPVKSFSLQELFAFPRQYIKEINSCGLFYTTFFNIPRGIKVPVITTIHDIIFPDMPELVSKAGLAARMFFYRRAARLSAEIITVSEFSGSRINFHLGSKTPVINASNAVTVPFSGMGRQKAKKKNIILFIGNIKKHKGLDILLDAFQGCREEGLDYRLFITGSKDNFRSNDRKAAGWLTNPGSRNITFTGFISDAEKEQLLAEAALLVQPSLYEGFGYPPLEAMLSGTAALISDIPVFREIYGLFPVTFFKAGDSMDLKKKIMGLLHNKEPEQPALTAALAERYSFRKTAAIILNEFNRCLRAR